MSEQSAEEKKKIADALAGFGFDEIDAAPEYEPFVDGVYEVVFDNKKSKPHVSDKSVSFMVVFEVTDGDYKGRRLYHHLYIQSQDPMAQRIAKRDMLKIGLGKSDLAKPPVIPGKFQVVVEMRGKDARLTRIDQI